MSIFGKIMSAIFGTKAGAAPASGGSAASPASGSAASAAPAFDYVGYEHALACRSVNKESVDTAQAGSG